jgi:AcrR family transcriptional regulator
MIAHKEDLRITKTRAALTGAFFEMLADMELSEITVNKLCEKSGVRRATFYKHFSDKEDFILYVIKDVRIQFEKRIWNKEKNPTITREYYHRYAEELLSFLLRNETAIKRMVSAPIRSAFIDTFLQQNYEDTTRRLEESVRAGMHLLASPSITASMIIGGVSMCIIHWFEAEDRCSAKELLNDIFNFIDRILA